MGKKKSRKAGEKLAEYGDWGDSWKTGVAQQQLKASGTYDQDSELAKKFASLNTDGKSRVDDDEGWSELKFDSPIKSAADYEELVNKWSAAGFDVRAIDMKTDGGRDFSNSNLAVRIADGNYGDPEPSTGGGSASTGSGGVAQTVGGNIGAGAGAYLSPTMNVNQDNDITNTISGNNNTVTNNQDNSVTQTTIDNSNNSRYYGGSNRYFSYGAGNPVAPESNPYDVDPQTPMPSESISKVNEDDFLSNFLKGRFADNTFMGSL